jgi:two-component system cell cycle sensor histidine kinase/response regulator CckA
MSALAQTRLQGNDVLIQAAALEACAEPVAILEDGRLLYSNPPFSDLLGNSGAAPLQGAPLAQVFADPASFERDHPERGEFPSVSTLKVLRRDGVQLRLPLSCSRFQVGSRNFLVLSLRDPRSEGFAEPSEKQTHQLEALGRVAGAVAHDFNNLLTGILLYCDLLTAGLAGESPLRAYVNEIRRAGGHSAELVEQLMAVARPGSEVSSAHSWNEVIGSIHNLLVRLLGENIELQVEPGGSSACVLMDSAQMRQILLNLLLNARDAMPAGGRVALSVSECGTWSANGGVELTVADSGCGMDVETCSQIFETFFTTKQPGKGTGLGLATIHRLVQEHGGEVRVASEPGHGTRMSVLLPRVPAPEDVTSTTQEGIRGNS